ncbi:tryptophan 7-halogenase [Streptomyces sp. NBC_00503]|uniref:tryptophan 7-halogenase n=1 Tax=Streptomyces sp. NBC_00503 TaxID=2903659 RepID=UPI002E81427B|nr:tryptophan 7-halogenase [Streptomyces sp. NBC_00503]WUD86310.1 tryptophan 7-halogenase [Streptomyces sp. NBC_00503]
MDTNAAATAAPTRIRKAVIAGGTLTAWIAAARLASACQGTVGVTVLETPHRPEPQVTALAPNLQRDLFDRLGIPEHTWMRASEASFDAAVKYVNWGVGERHFYVPQDGTPADCEGFPLSDFWLLRRRAGQTVEPLDHACFREPPLMDARKSPRWLDGRAAITYGWHADTFMLTHFLRRKAMENCGVRMVTGELLGAHRDENGMMTALHTTRGDLTADFFLDCTGSESLLLAGVLGEPFTGAGDRLLADSALSLTLPHDSDLYGVEPYTTATALPHGWTWRRHLLGRQGAGLVYASTLTTPDEAARSLRRALGLPRDHAEATHIPLRVGHTRRTWVKNCVALGAAAWFTDPLADDQRATLDLLDRLIRDFPSADYREAPAARFNRAAADHYRRALDLAQLRYAASPRTDAPFWTAQRALPLPDDLHATVEAHRDGLSSLPDEAPLRTLLAALTPHTAAPPPALAHHPHALRTAEDHFTRIARGQRILGETLPEAHTYLDRLHGGIPELRTARATLGTRG